VTPRRLPAPICSDSPDLAGPKGPLATAGPLAAGRFVKGAGGASRRPDAAKGLGLGPGRGLGPASGVGAGGFLGSLFGCLAPPGAARQAVQAV
jgi:hypothetical protein